MRKRVMKLAAAALILAMSASVIPTGAGRAEAKSAQVSAVTEDEKEALKTIMKENREYLFNLTDNHNVAIMNYQVAEPAKLAEVWAGALAEGYKGLKSAEPITTGPINATLITLNGKKLEVYDVTKQVIHEYIGPGLTLKNVKEVRIHNTTKITVKQVEGKKTTYATYKLGSKIKKSTVYTKKGKTYKKGTKKIKKKAYKKFIKSYKKLKTLKFKKVTPIDLTNDRLAFYTEFMSYFYSNSLTCSIVDSNSEVFRYDPENAGDPYQAFTADCEGGKEYYTRQLLAPNVKNPKTGKTYQEEEWAKYRELEMGPDVSVSYLYNMIENLGGEDSPAVLAEVFPQEITSPTGETINATRYCVEIEQEDRHVDVVVGKDGELEGKIIAIESGSMPAEAEAEFIYVYRYDMSEDEQPMPYDILAPQQIYPTDSSMVTGTRKLTINYEGSNSEIKNWDVVTSDQVRLDIPFINGDEDHGKAVTNNLGGFYLKTSDGTKALLPPEGTDPYFSKFQDDFNVWNESTNAYSTDEVLASGIYWTDNKDSVIN